jgi:hypothetical protein
MGTPLTLAGHVSLQDMISQTIESAREKLAAAEDKKESKEHEAKEKKMAPGEKAKEEAKEKQSSAILDIHDPEDMTKLAEALDEMAADLLEEPGLEKDADSIENGGESRQGGQQLPTQSPTGGTQPYKRDAAKHQVPTSTGMKATKDNPGAATAVPTDDERAPGGNGAKYPAKGVLKTAAVERLQAALEKKAFAITREGHKLDAKRYGAISKAHHDMAGAEDEYAKEAPYKTLLMRLGMGQMHRLSSRNADYAAKKHEHGKNAWNPFGGMATKSRHEKDEEGKKGKEKKSGLPVPPAKLLSAKEYAKRGLKTAVKAAVPLAGGYALGRMHEKEKKSEAETTGPVDFILSKVAEFHGGGETLDDKKLPVPMPPGRSLVQNKDQIKNVTKREAKAPRKAELAQVLTEPAMTSSTDSKVQENLRNATKGGVKIAEARAELQKIAADPNDPRHEALKKAIAEWKAEKGEKKDSEKNEEKKS